MVERSITYLNDIKLDSLKGFGEKRYSSLKKSNLSSVADLLRFFPKKHIDRSKIKKIIEIDQTDIDKEVTMIGNISSMWWSSINNLDVEIYPIDTAIIQSSEVWKASGHLAEFTDPMVDHKPTGERFRADQVPKDLKKEDLTEPRQFNLMFETSIGPVENENSAVYLRP